LKKKSAKYLTNVEREYTSSIFIFLYHNIMPNKPEVGKSQESNLSKEKVKKSWDQQQD
jgi:hypothetical protein